MQIRHRRHDAPNKPGTAARGWLPWLIICLWAVACWAFFQLAYAYHFFYQEQNQLFLCSADYVATYRGTGWLARLTGDYLTQYYYYLYAGAIILTLTLTATGTALFAGLKRWKLNRWLALAVALVVITVQAVFHLRYDYPLSGSIAMLGWTLLVLISAIARRKWVSALVGVALVPLGIWLLGAPRLGKIAGPEWMVERVLAIDNEYRFGNYDKVISLVEQEENPLPEMKFFYNLVMAQRGELPDRLLRYVPNELGTLHRIGPETPLYTIKNMNELYWVLGDMTFTERAAMMANVFSADNRNVRMVKRLAECNIVSGDTLAAHKYLRLLEQTVAYDDWARQAPTSAFYQQKAQMRNLQDTLAVTDNSHFIMMQLLDSNPNNIVALDYMLCTELLLKDITNFKRDYDRYCASHPRQKRLYQEALCIWLAGSDAPAEQWQELIVMPDVLQRFQQYNQQRGSQAFKDTYWYYFDKAQTPMQP
ncbi:MAG: DUF6057 family protein [Prevotella sp.]|nr:DUF6057 family protein [Prevotella sp.]